MYEKPLRSTASPAGPDVICLSHLRWDFVFQRPHHLLSRCARNRRVFFFEEPVVSDEVTVPELTVEPRVRNLHVARLTLPRDAERHGHEAMRAALKRLIAEQKIRDYVLWYYTPLALSFARHLEPRLVVYDCMDELSAFAGADPAMAAREAELLARADVVFCGGMSLYEAKKHRHRNIHAFPSSIDADHFGMARRPLKDPHDQARVAHPRLGYFGVIDERMDYALLDGVAAARPGWQIVMIGPVVKVDPARLPRRPNLHWLGGKPYTELPNYLAGWDVALIPFAMNDATRFVSPTKTPEYLAAGKPVVSTPVRDVVRTYGGADGIVEIAGTVPEFVAACERALTCCPPDWRERVDALLAQTSWDATWRAMERHLEHALARTRPLAPAARTGPGLGPRAATE